MFTVQNGSNSFLFDVQSERSIFTGPPTGHVTLYITAADVSM